MLDRAPVFPDNALRRTSAWGNAFLERDHIARRSGRPAVPLAPHAAAGAPAATPAAPATPTATPIASPASAPRKDAPS